MTTIDPDQQNYMATVKNTFINMELPTPSAPPRRSSVPPSSRLCRFEKPGVFDSDISTCSTCSESGLRTPMSMDEQSPVLSECFPQEEFTPISHQFTAESLQRLEFFPSLAMSSEPRTPSSRLNSKAAAFQPRTPTQDLHQRPQRENLQKHVIDVVDTAKAAIAASEHASNVEIVRNAKGFFVVIQPDGQCDSDLEVEMLSKLAKDAFLDAASQSKCVYVMGYCNPQLFGPKTHQSHAFELSLGVMLSATSACWHIYKKGFCRHGKDCCKHHPVLQVPVHVLIEAVRVPPCAHIAQAFNQEVGDLALAVTSQLSENPYVERVEAYTDKASRGWTIEITRNGAPDYHEDYLDTLARTTLFTASSTSSLVKIIGYATMPFVSKPHGFVAQLGDMRDEKTACWEFLSKGACTWQCSCRWEHPQCLMPINVVLKEKATQLKE